MRFVTIDFICTYLNIGGDICLPLRQTKKHGIDVNI